ncbi:MAG: ribonuclease HI [Candidatus Eisenbacteria bacterium]|nr:ribonuclease HI [Candidatus Latescibacterota bacterium]MBD3302217.1 ribonuclease HI [Candidatus Eisenbacteria bacterium]
MTAVGGEKVRLYTDGACSGNPGPGGWGAILVDDSTGARRTISGGAPATTNNRMELTAVIEGLRLLRRPSDVDVYTDSVYVAKGITEWIHDWVRRGWKTAAKKPVLNEDLWRALLDLVERQQRIDFHWVRGHAGHPENEECDRLAVRACEEIRGKGRKARHVDDP